MRAVKSRNTTPELAVRKIARTISSGYRLNRADLPGKPDLAWIGAKRAIFVHGCFWHGHECRRGARIPKENRDYWVGKIARNKARDVKNRLHLEAAGWRVLTIWECELRDTQEVEARLRAFLT
ncbi:MAG TPA: very short patch repair endonuclease [Rhizobiaceae bacterium]|nr:very short patch repair endonuclease [Rhizobiaceae bacterium]